MISILYTYHNKKMKKDINFKNLESLDSVKRVLAEAEAGLGDKTRRIDNSSMPEALGAAIGIGAGGAVSFAALYLGGSVVGLSAAGITSGLATAGALAGGGMAAGIAVLAAPVALLGIAGYGLVSANKKKKLKEAKEAMLQEVIRKHDAVIRVLKEEINSSKERLDYLNSLNTMLQAAIRDLQNDLQVA